MTRFFPLGLVLLTAAGCSSVEPSEPFMYWRKSAIGVRVATPAELEQIAEAARAKLATLDLKKICEPLLAAELPPGTWELEIVRFDSLFGTDWRPAYWDLEGKLLRARLSVAVGNDWMAGGDLKAEAILAGFEPEGQPHKVLTARLVTEVVEKLAALCIDVAEEQGKRAAVVSLEESGP